MRVGAAAVMERRGEWVASLRSSLPQFTDRSKDPLMRGHVAAVLGSTSRRLLDDAVDSSRGTSSLLLPDNWREQATKQLSTALHGIVLPQHLSQTDYFLCSLIHPSYIQPSTIRSQNEAVCRKMQQEYRRTVCMPLELTMTGSKSLRLLSEVTCFVEQGAAAANFSGRRPSAVASGKLSGDGAARDLSKEPSAQKSSLDASWPELSSVGPAAFVQAFRLSGLDSLVLCDPSICKYSSTATSADGVLSREVSLSAVTALCGSIELVAGWSSLLQFADRVAREQGGPRRIYFIYQGATPPKGDARCAVAVAASPATLNGYREVVVGRQANELLQESVRHDICLLFIDIQGRAPHILGAVFALIITGILG